MTVPLDNMTEQEIAHFARIAEAPIEHQTHFRQSLNSLLRCYGEGADAGCTVLYVDYKAGTLDVVQINVTPPESYEHMRVAIQNLGDRLGVNPVPTGVNIQ